MSDLGYLLTPALAFFIAAAAPGPATLATAATAMAHGRRAAFALGAGLSLGLALWGIVAAAGFGAVILAWAPALLVLRLAGAGFLLWLAWRSAQSALRPAGSGSLPDMPAGAMFRRGFLLNILNPKAVLAWGAVIALGLPEGAGPAELSAIIVVCSVLGVAIYAGYASAFSLAWMREWYRRARRWIDACCALGFGLAGVRLAVWRVDAP